MFYYGFLLHYLHLMLEWKNPLIAFLCASRRSFSIQSLTKPVSIKLLWQAWNSFARLLGIDWSDTFLCLVCGPSPHTIICDGTLLGQWVSKGFESHPASHTTRTTKSVQGKQISWSCFVEEPKVERTTPRVLRVHQGQETPAISQGTDCNWVSADEGSSTLADLIARLASESKCCFSPQQFREILSELSRNTPVCGLLQVAGNDEVLSIIDVIPSGVDISQPSHREQLKSMLRFWLVSSLSATMAKACQQMFVPSHNTWSSSH